MYKYVTKGSDRTLVTTEVEGQAAEPRDEIAEYMEVQYVGSSEAVWHLMTFPIAKRYPPLLINAELVQSEDPQALPTICGHA